MRNRSLPLFLALWSVSLFAAACGGESDEAKADASIVSFVADPASVKLGESALLQWETRNADAVEIFDAAGNAVPLSGDAARGAVRVQPLADTTYELHAVGPSGKHATQTATVAVEQPEAPPSIAQFTATPEAVAPDGEVTLTWSVQGANEIAITANGGRRIDVSGTSPVDGSVKTTIANDTTFTLRATGPGGTTTATAAVAISFAPVVSLQGPTAPIVPGGVANISWSARNAERVVITNAAGETLLEETSGLAGGTLSQTLHLSDKFTLTATGVGGTTTRSTTVQVQPQIVRFDIDTEGPVRAGDEITVSWVTRGGKSGVLDNGAGSVITLDPAELASGSHTLAVGPSGIATLSVISDGLEATSVKSIAVTLAPRIRSFTIADDTMTGGPGFPAIARLSWNIDGAEELQLVAEPGGLINIVGKSMRGDSIDVPVTASTTFELIAKSRGGTNTATTQVTLTSIPQVLAFGALPSRVGPGQSAPLSWQVIDATSVRLERDDVDLGIDPTLVAGTHADPLTAAVDGDSFTYVLYAQNALGYEVESAPITVGIGAPIIAFAVDRTEVAARSTVNFSWQSAGGHTLELLGPDDQPRCSSTDAAEIAQGVCENVAVSPREATEIYKLRVTNGVPGAERTTEQQIAITVVGGPVIQQFTADKTELTAGETITFTAVVDPDADGVVPTVTLEDDRTPPTSYPISCTDFSNCVFTVTPEQGDITAFTLRATTPGTTPPAPQTLPINVYTYPAIANVAFTPTLVESNGGTASSTLAWTTEGGVSLEVFRVEESGETQVYASTDLAQIASGSQTLDLPAGDTTYRVLITNPLGVTASATASVLVDPAAVTQFTASRTQILRGETAELTWTTRNADHVALDPFTASVTVGQNGFIDIRNSPTVRDVATTSATNWITVGFPQGFSFPWYGTNVTGLRMFAYGYLSFDTAAGTTTANGPFPRSITVQTRDVQMAPFWDLMNRVATAKTLWDEITDTNGRKGLVFQWVGMQFPPAQTADNPSDLNFEVVLWEDGDFEYHYGTMQGASQLAQGAGATIGYQDMPDANNVNHAGFTFSHDRAYPGGLTGLSLYFDAQLPPNGSWTVQPYDNTTYELVASNGYSSDTESLQIEVFEPADVIGALATETEQDIGETVTIVWSTSGATAIEVVDQSGTARCTATPDQFVSGSCVVSETVPGNYVYTLRVHGTLARDIVERAFPVAFVEPLSATLTADVTTVDPGGTATISWQTTGAVSGSITANGAPLASATNPSGSMQVSPADTTTYVIEVAAADGRTSITPLTINVRTAQLALGGPSTVQVTPDTVVPISWTGTGGNVTISPQSYVQETTGARPFESIHLDGTPLPMGSTGTGTSATWSGTFTFPQGFTFPYNGVPQTQIMVGMTGWASFTSASATGVNSTLPKDGRHLAVFWDTLLGRSTTNGGTGDVFWALRNDGEGSYLVIQWHNLRYNSNALNNGDSLNFQLILRDNGDIEYRYGQMFTSNPAHVEEMRGSSATIGLTSFDGTEAVTVSYNTEQARGIEGRSFLFSSRAPKSTDTFYASPTETTTYTVCIDSTTGNYRECREVTVVVVQPGDLLFTELMIDPVAPGVDWVELRNFAPYPINLADMSLRSANDAEYKIGGSLPFMIEPGESIVFASGPMAGANVENTGLVLDPASDSVELAIGSANAFVVDAVSWSAWNVTAGSSLSLDGLAARRGMIAGNDANTAWCTAATPYDGANNGNPGLHGPTCSSASYDVDAASGADWIELEGSPFAIEMVSAAGANAFEAVPGGLGFTMPFFGQPVSDLHVARHGYTSFVPLTAATTANANIPTTGVPNGTVASFWDSMQMAVAGDSSIWTELRTVGTRSVRVVQWNNFHPTNTTAGLPATWQTQLWSDGEIVTIVKSSATSVNYNRGSSATLGLENIAGNEAVKYAYNEDGAVFPGLAIRYTPKAAPQP